MKHQVYTILRLISISVALGLASCGGAKGKSASLGVSIIPERPIVITGNGVSFTGTVITAPWFGFSVTMTNPTDEPITIIGLQMEVSSLDSNGEVVTTTFTSTPAEFNRPYGDSISCTHYTFGTIPANTTTDTPLSVTLSGVPECTAIPVFTPSGIPSGPSKNNFYYKVKIKPLGWFGTYTTPSDRLEKFKYFTTQ